MAQRSRRDRGGPSPSAPCAPALACCAAALLAASCQRQPTQVAENRPAGKEPANIAVTAARGDLVFTWIDAAGAYHDVTRIEDVPEASRAQVLVRDLSRSPDELHSADFLYLADLRQADENGRFTCGAVSRRQFERGGVRELAAQAAAHAAPGPEAAVAPEGSGGVILYTTSWCGVCRKAKEFLRKRGVAFVEKDVERDAAADAELQERARAIGVRPQGVPVIDVAGELMMGFDPDALAALLRRKGL